MESLEDAVEIEKINKINKADFLSDVPAHLRFQVTENIYEGVANKVLIFKGRDPDLISNMIPKMIPMKVKKNEYLYRKGQFSSSIYLIFHGRVVEMDNDINFREYSVGSYFGEVEIFKNCPRKYNVKTLEECQLMEINRDDLLNTLKFYPELKIDMITYAIIKDMKTKQTLHKIKDLRSLIRVDLFWRKEETEFARSVGEKIQGLYYFNKKKYENILKLKQSTRGWFKLDQMTKNNKKKPLTIGSNQGLPALKPLRLTDSKTDSFGQPSISLGQKADGDKPNFNFSLFAAQNQTQNDPQGGVAEPQNPGLVSTAKRRMSRDLFTTLMELPLAIREAEQGQEDSKSEIQAEHAKVPTHVEQKVMLDKISENLDGMKKDVTDYTSNIQRVNEKVSELDVLMKKLITRVKSSSHGQQSKRKDKPSFSKTNASGGVVLAGGLDRDVTVGRVSQPHTDHLVEVPAQRNGLQRPGSHPSQGTQAELKVPELKDKDVSHLSESMNLSGEVEQIKLNQSAKARGEEFHTNRSAEDNALPMKFTINPANHLNGEMEKFFESIEAVEDNFDKSERTIKSKLYSIGNIPSSNQMPRTKGEDLFKNKKAVRNAENLIAFEDSDQGSQRSQEPPEATERSQGLVRRFPGEHLRNLELIHETDEGIERSVSHKIGTNTNSRGAHGEPSSQAVNHQVGGGAGTGTSSMSGVKSGLQNRVLAGQGPSGTSPTGFNNYLQSQQQTQNQANQKAHNTQTLRKSAGHSRDIGELLKEFDREQDNQAFHEFPPERDEPHNKQHKKSKSQ